MSSEKKMKETQFEPLGLLEIDTDIHYDLDMSKFPGLEDPDSLREPALLISSQKPCESWFDVITGYEYDNDDGNVTEDDILIGDDEGCAFCDALNVDEETENNVPHFTEPCYVRGDSPNILYYFNDSHDCQTVEITDESQEPSIYLQCEEEEIECDTISEEKTYWLNTSNLETSTCAPEVEVHLPGSVSETVQDVQDVLFTELTACQYLCDEEDDTSPPSPYMDMCITEQLPLFIDLVDQISPVLSPSGHVRSRKGDNSIGFSGEPDSLTYFLASDEGLLTIDTSMTSVNRVISREETVFPRGS